jgi:hypothetical protein
MAQGASGDKRGTKTGVRVQTASKAEVRKAGFRPATQIEGEKEERNQTYFSFILYRP